MCKSTFLFVIGLALCLSLSIHAGTYSGGLGTPADPFEISSVADWQQLMTHSGDWASNFKLMADIDLAGVTVTPVGNSTTLFNGAFYGNFHVVRNATIDLPTNHHVGLFGFVNLGGIRDLGVVSTNIKGLDYVGGLVGQMYSSGTITNCYTTGSVSGTSWYVGGLVGYNYGKISSCYSTAVASAYYYVGGLVGMNYYSVNGNLTNCYATGETYGVNYVAGLVGYDYSGTIINCYATGKVHGNEEYVYGLVGVNYYGTITSCFWDTQTTGKTVGIGYGITTGAKGKLTAEMKTLSTFTSAPASWDFTNETANGISDYWRMCMDGVNYPHLNWESIRGDFVCPNGVNTEDLSLLVQWWLSANCTSSNAVCGGTDMDSSGSVDFKDFAIFAQNWLEGVAL
jgi:hypothetical protein